MHADLQISRHHVHMKGMWDDTGMAFDLRGQKYDYFVPKSEPALV